MNYNPRFNHVLLLLLYKDDTIIISKPMMVASSIVSIPIKVFRMDCIIVIQRCLHQEKERKTWNHIQHQFISRLYTQQWYLVHQLHSVA